MNKTILKYTYSLSIFLLTSFYNLDAQLPIVNGWTQFTASADSRIIYISSTGNDATAQVYSVSSTEIGSNPFNPTGTIMAYQTIAAAKLQLRSGFPDWILFKKGETFTNQFFGVLNLNGRNENEPILISSYGTSNERPKILTSTGSFIEFTGNASNIAIVGLYAEPHTRTGNDEPVGVNILNAPFNHFLVEDCYFNLFFTAIIAQDYGSSNPLNHKNFTARRNILTNGYKLGGGGGGVYMHRIDSILFEDNLIDHNGWSTIVGGAPATGFSHNTYFQSTCKNIIFRNNVVSRASAVGGGLRSGGIVYNNLFLYNPKNIFIGSSDQGQINWPTEGVSANVGYNVVLDARPEPGFNDFGNGIVAERVRNANIHHNIVAHFSGISTYGSAVFMNRIENVNLNNNIIYNWGNNQTSGIAYSNGINIGNVKLGNNSIDSNEVQLKNRQAYCVNTNGSYGNITYSGNQYYNVLTASNWFPEGNFSAYQTASGDLNSMTNEVPYSNPERNIEFYLMSIMQTGGLDGFITLRKNLSKDNWDIKYTANTVNNYIRQGFNMDLINEENNTEVNQLFSFKEFNVYPNPNSTHNITIELKENASFSFKDSMGKNLQSGDLNKGLNSINLSDLNTGIYFITINNVTQKIIIQ